MTAQHVPLPAPPSAPQAPGAGEHFGCSFRTWRCRDSLLANSFSSLSLRSWMEVASRWAARYRFSSVVILSSMSSFCARAWGRDGAVTSCSVTAFWEQQGCPAPSSLGHPKSKGCENPPRHGDEGQQNETVIKESQTITGKPSREDTGHCPRCAAHLRACL